MTCSPFREAYGACAKLDGMIAATPFIRDKFLAINPNTLDINNFPLLHELEQQTAWADKRADVFHVGGTGKIRGIQEVCTAMGQLYGGIRGIREIQKKSKPRGHGNYTAKTQRPL